MASSEEIQLKIIISEVIKEVKAKELEENEGFIKFFIKLLILNPKYGKLVSKGNIKECSQFFSETVVKMLSDKNDPSILSLKMQNHFEENYNTSENLIKKNQEIIIKKTEPLQREIINTRPITKEENEKLFRRISIYLVLKSGLGNPSNIQVLREGTAALHSIFSMDDLRRFVDSPLNEKRSQLDDLLSIVSGIRIFNKDCGKGGEHIPELTSNLTEAIEATSLALSHCLIRIMERVNLLTTSIDPYVVIGKDPSRLRNDLKVISVNEMKEVCKVLSLYRQYEVFVRKLIDDMDKVHIDHKELIVNFTNHLYDLHSLVRFRTAVPADQVFPYFMKLWEFWRSMQNNMFLISTINSVMWNLDTFHENLDAPHKVIDRMLNGRKIISDAQRIRKIGDAKIEKSGNKCIMAYPGEKVFRMANIQYLGFCAVCVCVGALIPANSNMGLSKWMGKYYAFCDTDHGKYFGFNPDRCVKEALDFIRANPESINFLRMFEEAHAVRNVSDLVVKTFNIVAKEEKEIQTETHPVPFRIDKNYNWNAWDIKRKICQTANLTNSRTHSTQTGDGGTKKSFGCQTDERMDKTVQTVKDSGTSSTPRIRELLWKMGI